MLKKIDFKAVIFGFLYSLVITVPIVSLVLLFSFDSEAYYLRHDTYQYEMPHLKWILVANFLVSLIGGILTGRISKHFPILNALCAGLVTFLVGLLFLPDQIDNYPKWFLIVDNVLTIPVFCVGGFVAKVLLEQGSLSTPKIDGPNILAKQLLTFTLVSLIASILILVIYYQQILPSANTIMQLEILASRGDVKAELTLGKLNFKGTGVPMDQRAGVRLIQSAANKGDAEAQWYLGIAYLHGNGIDQNAVRAYEWFLLAKKNGKKEYLMNMAETARKSLSSQEIADADQWVSEWKPLSHL